MLVSIHNLLWLYIYIHKLFKYLFFVEIILQKLNIFSYFEKIFATFWLDFYNKFTASIYCITESNTGICSNVLFKQYIISINKRSSLIVHYHRISKMNWREISRIKSLWVGDVLNNWCLVVETSYCWNTTLIDE